jgi:BMFP domain-containing protein YqiC
MPREKGDKNFSERELRLRAENEALKAKVKAVEARFKGELKVKNARLKELRSKVKSGN